MEMLPVRIRNRYIAICYYTCAFYRNIPLAYILTGIGTGTNIVMMSITFI